ncbi:hypothetical protein ES703_118808 [subsurface metagenome]
MHFNFEAGFLCDEQGAMHRLPDFRRILGLSQFDITGVHFDEGKPHRGNPSPAVAQLCHQVLHPGDVRAGRFIIRFHVLVVRYLLKLGLHADTLHGVEGVKRNVIVFRVPFVALVRIDHQRQQQGVSRSRFEVVVCRVGHTHQLYRHADHEITQAGLVCKRGQREIPLPKEIAELIHPAVPGLTQDFVLVLRQELLDHVHESLYLLKVREALQELRQHRWPDSHFLGQSGQRPGFRLR